MKRSSPGPEQRKRHLHVLFLHHNVPAVWREFVLDRAERQSWMHYFLWEAYQLLDLLQASGIHGLQGMRGLEPGSGLGLVGTLLALMGADVVLFDNDPYYLEQAEANARLLGIEHGRLRFVYGNLHALPFAKGSFDLVWNEGVIEHFPTPVQVIQGMASVVREGGRVFVAVPGSWTLHSLVVRPWRRFRRSFPFDGWGREKSYTEKQLASMMHKAGLHRIQTSTCNLRRALLDDYAFLPLLTKHMRLLVPALFNGLALVQFDGEH